MGCPSGLQDYRGTNSPVFFLGDECVHCMEQLTAINARSSDWAEENTVVLGSAVRARRRRRVRLSRFNVRLLSDPTTRMHGGLRPMTTLRRSNCISTVLFDTQGRVHWKDRWWQTLRRRRVSPGSR